MPTIPFVSCSSLTGGGLSSALKNVFLGDSTFRVWTKRLSSPNTYGLYYNIGFQLKESGGGGTNRGLYQPYLCADGTTIYYGFYYNDTFFSIHTIDESCLFSDVGHDGLSPIDLCVEIDFSGKFCTFFINNVQRETVALVATALAPYDTVNHDFIIEQYLASLAGGAGSPFADIQVWPSRLNSTDRTLYRSTRPDPNVVSMITYWKCDEGSGTLANDATANNLDLTLSSPVWTTGDIPSGASINSVTVSPPTATIYKGNRTQLTAIVAVTGSPDPSVTWTSSNDSIASVSSSTGLVTGNSIGTATITATSVFDPTKFGTASITVIDPPVQYAVAGSGIDLQLNASGDLDLVDSDCLLVGGIEEIAQHMRIRLQYPRGDWFKDPTIGMPYFEQLLGQKYNAQVVANLFRRALLLVPGVLGVTSLNTAFDRSRRILQVSFTASTIEGDVSTVQEFRL